MPERWERELRKLRREEMPAGVRARAHEGPRAEPMPPPRQRVVAAGVAIAVFLAAGAFAFQALRPIGGGRLAGDTIEPALTEATLTFLASGPDYPDIPYAEMTVNGETVRGQLSSHEWRGVHRDTGAPSFVAPVHLPLGSQLVIAGDADAVAGLFADPATRGPVEDLRLSDQGGYVIVEPGEYFLLFEAKWNPDVVPFYFPIEVRPVEPELTDADADLSITAYPFEAVLSYGGQRVALPERAGSWQEGGKVSATEGLLGRITVWARIQIPVGTPLELSGNWEDWSNHLEPGDGRVAANDQGSLVFPSAAGTYDWRMTASWPHGQAEFVFGVDLVDAPAVASQIEQPSTEISDVLRVRCDEQGIHLRTPVVAAQEDGLHVLADVSGMTDPEIRLRSPRFTWVEWWSGSSGVDGEFIRPVPVGTALVHCESGPQQGDGPEIFQAQFEVADPNGYFVDYALGCLDEGEELSFTSDRFPPDPVPGSAEEAVRLALTGLNSEDVVEAAGYLAFPHGSGVVRVTRDGSVIGRFLVHGDAANSWFVITGNVCPGSGLGVREA